MSIEVTWRPDSVDSVTGTGIGENRHHNRHNPPRRPKIDGTGGRTENALGTYPVRSVFSCSKPNLGLCGRVSRDVLIVT